MFNPNQPINSLKEFLRKYLVATDQQLLVLALWIIHAWCYRAFNSTPYLNIQSPGPQSGKTRCLQLLHLLCPPGSWLATGPQPANFTKKLLALKPQKPDVPGIEQDLPSVVLLDDREHTLSSSESDPMTSLLKSGAEVTGRYLARLHSSQVRELSAFCPKALAGTAPLPPSLAARSVPIVLRRNTDAEPVERWKPDDAAFTARPFLEWLKTWSEENVERLAATLSVCPLLKIDWMRRSQVEMIYPLILIAYSFKNPVPQDACRDLVSLFDRGEDAASTQGLQLLRDMRGAFTHFDNPAQLPTAHLIQYLHRLEYRPWSQWGRSSAHHIARLLRPFGIYSEAYRMDAKSVVRAYSRTELEEVWARY